MIRVTCDICEEETTIPPLEAGGRSRGPFYAVFRIGWEHRITADLCEECERELHKVITEWIKSRKEQHD